MLPGHGAGVKHEDSLMRRVPEGGPPNTIQAPSGAACLRIKATPGHIPVSISRPLLRRSAAFDGHTAMSSRGVFALPRCGVICYWLGVGAKGTNDKTETQRFAEAPDAASTGGPTLAFRSAGSPVERHAAGWGRPNPRLLPCGGPGVPSAPDHSVRLLRDWGGHGGLGRGLGRGDALPRLVHGQGGGNSWAGGGAFPAGPAGVAARPGKKAKQLYSRRPERRQGDV